MKTLTQVLCLVALAVGCSKNAPQAVEKVDTVEEKPTPHEPATKNDFDILDVVLLDLSDFEGFKTTSPTKIILDPMTAGYLDLIGQVQLDVETFSDKEFAVPVELGDDLRRRNPVKPISLAGYTSPGSKILVEKIFSSPSGEENSENTANSARFSDSLFDPRH